MTRESPRWDDVRVFLAVHRHGSMAGAARALKVDQTTVGRRLQAFEESLDARLFDRTPEGFSLTPAGESILDVAERAEESMLTLERRVSGEDARIAGTVRIATSDTFAHEYLVARLPILRKRHPAIVLEIATAQSFVTLSRREADIAIRHRAAGAAPAAENVVCRKLFDVAWALYASREYIDEHGTPKDAQDLDGWDVIDFDDDAPSVGGPVFRKASARARVSLRATGLLTIGAAARAGLGIALLPAIFAHGPQPLVRVSETLAIAEAWLLVHSDLQHVARVRAVIDALVDLARSDAALLRGG